MMQMAAEAASTPPPPATPTPPTTPAGLPLTGPLQSSSTRLPSTTIVSPQAAPPPSSLVSQVLKHIRVPARFYAVNLLVGAAVMGAGTSVGQRLLCGKAPQRTEKAASMQ